MLDALLLSLTAAWRGREESALEDADADPVLADMFHPQSAKHDNVVLNFNLYYVGMMMDALDWLVC